MTTPTPNSRPGAIRQLFDRLPEYCPKTRRSRTSSSTPFWVVKEGMFPLARDVFGHIRIACCVLCRRPADRRDELGTPFCKSCDRSNPDLLRDLFS